MKKIGFIDNFLSEWHANNYPDMIRRHPLAKDGQMDVCYAYAKTEVSPYDGVSTDEWCEKYGVARVNSIKELVDSSDCIVVLSPDNPELHEELADYALRSGKPVYIDKTFAPDGAAAARMFALAKAHGTPMYSSSALRFADELSEFRLADTGAGSCVVTGPGRFDIYAIHLFEILTTVMKSGAARMMSVMQGANRALIVEYSDGRTGMYLQEETGKVPFSVSVSRADGSTLYTPLGKEYFERFVSELVGFFDDGKPRVPAGETIDLMCMLERARAAVENPYTWVEVEA